MPREARLVRRITAGAGGWPGDGANWSEGSPPTPVSAPHTEVGEPVFVIPIHLREHPQIPAHGVAGLVRVIGADSARRFDMQVFVEWLRIDFDGSRTRDWRLLTGAEPTGIGNGEDFTTDPAFLQDARVAFHLVPRGGNLAEGSIVEVWATEI